MPEPTVQRGGGPASARPGSAPYSSSRLDGRLDLDHLGAPLDLDVIGTDPDGTLLSERVRDLLESTGVAPFVRRHRASLVAGGLVLALVVGSAGYWWLARPVPLPDLPQILVKTSGADREQATLRAGDGSVVGLTLDVAVASVERRGVSVQLLSLAGPGLAAPTSGRVSLVDTGVTDSVSTVSAAIDCATPASADAAIAAEPDDFGVVVRRMAPEGEQRDDRVPLVGAQHLAQVVRSTCLQALADRELSVRSVTAKPLAGLAAADLVMRVASTGPHVWTGLRTSTRGLPWLINGSPAADLEPGGVVAIKTRLWLQDCANPSAVMAEGILLRTAFTPEDAEPNAADNLGNTFALQPGSAARELVDRAFATTCSDRVPAAVVTQAIVHEGGNDTSAGTLELTLRVRADGASIMEVAQGGSRAGGLLKPAYNPVHLVDGVGVLQASWELPLCSDLVPAGVPEFAVNVFGVDSKDGEGRPYLMPLSGDELRVALVRVCGAEADGVVR